MNGNLIPVPAPKEKYSDFEMRRQLKKVKSGVWIGGLKHSIILSVFNCDTCQWKDTPLCPHGLKGKEKHTNNICSEKVLFLKEAFELAKTQPRVFQLEQLLKLKFLDDSLYNKYWQTGELDKDYHHISKNLITLIDKMRRQDEGIKIQGEMTHTFEQFRDIVETQAKQVKEAEFKETKDEAGDNGRGQEKN